MDAKTFTDRQYECDQAISAVEDAVRRFRYQWGQLAGRLAFENADTTEATATLDGGIAALSAVATEMRVPLDKFIADIEAERNPPVEVPPGEDTLAA